MAEAGEGSATGSATDGSKPGRGGSSAAPSTTDVKALREPVRAAVRLVTHQINELAARDEVERDQGVWLADDQDEEGISEPVARILARKMKADGLVNPDLADAIAGAIAVAVYVSKAIARKAQLRRWRRAGAVDETGPVQDGPAEQFPPQAAHG